MAVTLCKTPPDPAWESHLAGRVLAAGELQLLAGAGGEPASWRDLFEGPFLIGPENTDCVQIMSGGPGSSLRERLEMSPPVGAGWVHRADWVDCAAQYLAEMFENEVNVYAIFEAGYSKSGDISVLNRSTMIIDSNLFYVVKLCEISSDVLAKYIRWSRSRRVLGGVFRGNIEYNMNDCQILGLVLDALDGDALLWLPARG